MTENDKTQRLTELRLWFSGPHKELSLSLKDKLAKDLELTLVAVTENEGQSTQSHPIELLLDIGAQINLGNYVIVKDDENWCRLTHVNTGESERALDIRGLMCNLLKKMEKKDDNN